MNGDLAETECLDLSVLTIHTDSDFLYVPGMLATGDPDGSLTAEHRAVTPTPAERFVRVLPQRHFRIPTCDFRYFYGAYKY